jgi:hypothetical protein
VAPGSGGQHAQAIRTDRDRADRAVMLCGKGGVSKLQVQWASESIPGIFMQRYLGTWGPQDLEQL